MKKRILIYKWRAYPYADVCEALERMGHSIISVDKEPVNYDEDPELEAYLLKKVQEEKCDFVFTMNYFAFLTSVCEMAQIPYVIWTCDNPLISMYHQKIFSKWNYIFTFDETNYLEFKGMGIEHIWYLPLAVNTPRLEYLFENATDLSRYENEVAFVGSLYEKNTYDELKDRLPDYLKGYFDAAIWAQQCISGGNILEEMLTVSILEQLQEHFKLEKSEESFSDLGLIFSTTVLGFKTAASQRQQAMVELSKKYPVTIYSNSDTKHLLRIKYGGSLDYWSEMPKVFRGSKINLNFTIPNIKSGLPLRIWDVLGAGGFLLTNYQAEIPRYFEHKKDLVCFESIDELSELVGYYLSHEEERKEIARNGYDKVKQYHSYENRMKYILEVLDN